MPYIEGINRELIQTTMERAHISGLSVAFGKKDSISTTNIGKTDIDTTSAASGVVPNTVFGAASLSKPVFAYLVLKLIENGVLSRPGEDADKGLDRPLHEILPLESFFRVHGKELSADDIERAKAITPRMILSHSSGIPMNGEAALNFEPGKEYEYSGIGLEYLQRTINNQTGKSLEVLAQEYVFGKSALDMEHSSFVPPGASEDAANSANSLFTTSSDYAKLMTAWMNDSNPIMQQAFVSQISLTQDKQKLPRETIPAAEHVDMAVKSHLAWGLGLGLELDDEGKTVKAFHTGDMSQFRAQMALDLKEKSCITYLSKGDSDLHANGHILAPLIITPKIPINYAHTWFYSKFPFAFNVEKLPVKPFYGLRERDPAKIAEDSKAVREEFLSEKRPIPDSTDLSWLRDLPKGTRDIIYTVPAGEIEDPTVIARIQLGVETLGYGFKITPSARLLEDVPTLADASQMAPLAKPTEEVPDPTNSRPH